LASLIDQLVGFVGAHGILAYATLFLAALLEAVPIIGSVIPGTTIILAMSALIPGGELHLVPVLASAITGAIIGDGTAFWIGHRSKLGILNAWPLSRYPGIVAQSETFFERYGTLAVFLARFVAPVRAVVPITAGALGMPPPRFYAVNIPAIVLWALAHVLPGVLAVTILHRYGGFAHPAALARHYWMPLVIVGGLVAGLAVWWLRHRRGINVRAKRPG
jgi:membrane-associated protein